MPCIVPLSSYSQSISYLALKGSYLLEDDFIIPVAIILVHRNHGRYEYSSKCPEINSTRVYFYKKSLIQCWRIRYQILCITTCPPLPRGSRFPMIPPGITSLLHSFINNYYIISQDHQNTSKMSLCAQNIKWTVQRERFKIHLVQIGTAPRGRKMFSSSSLGPLTFTSTNL